MNTKTILFISHDASRTGAPIILLHFLRWLKDNSDIPFQILLNVGGELQPEFEAIAPVSVFTRNIRSKRSLITRVLGRLGFHLNTTDTYLIHLREKLIQDNIGLIYSNTVVNGEVLEFLSSLECPVICHVHELESWIRHHVGFKKFEHLKERVHSYIAVSKAVKNNLIENHGIPVSKVNLVHEFIPAQFYNSKNHHEERNRICKQLSIPTEASIVCASGTCDWRKGPDLFIQLAHTVYQRQPEFNIYFLWIGGDSEGVRHWELMYDVNNLKLTGYVRFLGAQPNPLDYFAACDVFAMVSREDPFPLVCLEAASFCKPIVCFDRSGGAREFVEDDCGFVVPYLDINTLATKVLELLISAELRQKLGQRAAQKVQNRHDVSIAAPQIFDIIKQFL